MNAKNRPSIQKQIDQAQPHPNGKTRKLYRFSKDGVLLQVTGPGVKSWCFRYTHKRKTRVIGLGPIRLVSFDEACVKARKLRVFLDEGRDPLAERDSALRKQAEEDARCMTFKDCAEAYIEGRQQSWKSAKHAAQWRATLKKYAYPVFGNKPVAAVDLHMLRVVLDVIWFEINETAERVRGRVEKVLAWATVHGYRTGDNPARWAGNLSEIYPKRAAVRAIKHHSALPYAGLPDFMHSLEQVAGIGGWLMRFLILTATRTTEARAAEWSEINLNERMWSIPASRMKAARPHRVPLSEPAMVILNYMRAMNDTQAVPSKYVFNGQQWGKHPSEAIMLALLKRIGRTDIVPHGFRSTFRDFVAEKTDFPREVAEAALAHALQDKTEAAYQRGDYLEKRRELMTAWANFCMFGQASAGIDRQLPLAESVL